MNCLRTHEILGAPDLLLWLTTSTFRLSKDYARMRLMAPSLSRRHPSRDPRAQEISPTTRN